MSKRALKSFIENHLNDSINNAVKSIEADNRGLNKQFRDATNRAKLTYIRVDKPSLLKTKIEVAEAQEKRKKKVTTYSENEVDIIIKAAKTSPVKGYILASKFATYINSKGEESRTPTRLILVTGGQPNARKVMTWIIESARDLARKESAKAGHGSNLKQYPNFNRDFQVGHIGEGTSANLGPFTTLTRRMSAQAFDYQSKEGGGNITPVALKRHLELLIKYSAEDILNGIIANVELSKVRKIARGNKQAILEGLKLTQTTTIETASFNQAQGSQVKVARLYENIIRNKKIRATFLQIYADALLHNLENNSATELVENLKGSPNIVEDIRNNVLSQFLQTSKPIKRKEVTKVKAKPKRKAKVKRVKSPNTKAKTPKTMPPVSETASPKLDIDSIIGLVNVQLHSQLRDKIMGKGGARQLLNYRTGRFARSARLVSLQSTRGKTIEAFVTYMRFPYDTFAPGGRLYKPLRHPEKLIGKAIRQILKENYIQMTINTRLV